MTSHRRAHPAWLVSLSEWLVDALIGLVFGIIGAVLLVLATLWVQALNQPM